MLRDADECAQGGLLAADFLVEGTQTRAAFVLAGLALVVLALRSGAGAQVVKRPVSAPIRPAAPAF